MPGGISIFSMIAAMFGFTLGVVLYFRLDLVLYYGAIIFLSNAVGAVLVPTAYNAQPVSFWIRTGMIFAISVFVAGLVAQRSRSVILFAQHQASEAQRNAERMMKVTEKVREVANTLSKDSEQLAAATAQTYAAVEQVATTASEFSAAIDNVNVKTQYIDSTSKEVSGVAAAGRDSVAFVAEQANLLQSSIEATVKIIEDLGARSGRLGRLSLP